MRKLLARLGLGLTISLMTGGLVVAGVYLIIWGSLHILATAGFLSLLVGIGVLVFGLVFTHEVGERLIEAYQTLRRGKK